MLDDALSLRLRFLEDELCFTLRLVADVRAQLLRCDERFVQRLVTLAECAELLVKAARLGVEILVDPAQPLHLFGNLVAKLLHFRGIVATQRTAEVEPAYV